MPDAALQLIARAADGSARDGLSLLDRALAHMDGGTPLDEETMRGLLGLADRERIFDLFDLLMRGAVAEALAEFEAQYAMGADPAVILADLAELTHWLTRLKFVKAAQDDVAFSAALRARGTAAAEQLSTRVLSRVWQALLAGHDEVNRAMNAKAAADMVFIRLAHLADLPTPDELIKQFDSAPQGGAAASGNGTVSAGGGSQAAPTASTAMPGGLPSGNASGPASGSSSGPTASLAPQAAPVVQSTVPVLQNFQAVIDLAADKRDIGLKHALENGVHLVAFETAHGDRAGRLELRLADGQANIAQELTRKLRDWTGQSWVVSLSQAAGAPTVGSLKQSAAERREEAARRDPHVSAALAAFPGAEIISVSEFGGGDPAAAVPEDVLPEDDVADAGEDDG